MGVGVHHPPVPVSMRVVGPGGQAGVLVLVMTVVVAMGVDVLERLVDVLVLVPAQEKGRHGAGQQHRSDGVGGADRLAEEPEGETRADEGRTGEDCLGPRRTDLVRGGDLERDAGAVAERADRERGR